MAELVTKYQQYAEYKNSGVEWLGEIPKDWEVVPIKHLAILNPKKSTLSQDLMSDECSFVPMEKLKFNSLVLDEKKVIKDVYDGYTYFENEDILVAKVTPCFENNNTTIAKDLINGIGFGSSEIFVLRVNNKVNNRYLFYRLLETIFISVATAAMTGAGGLRRVPAETINTYSIAVPNVDEQTQIANFLDHETAQIDTLIEKQQTLIQLLKEKRQAVISHAVTKGLNPDAPMKDSGVEWLGDVPEHWEVSPLKYFIKSVRGAVKAGPFGSHLKGTDLEGEDVKVITQKNVIRNNIDIGDAFISFKKYNELKVFTIFEKDILITTRGTIGRTYVYDTNETAILHPCLIRIQIDENKAEPDLISLIIQESGYALEQILVNSNATTIEVIYSENLINTFITAPDNLSEQTEILNFIRVEKLKFDHLISKAEQAIQLMQERRTALISAAVTGKIDVRGWQAPVIAV